MNARRADSGKRVNGTARNAVDHRKQAVSIRMSRGDVRQIKQLADRLGVRDSDVIRYAIKTMLSRLAPLPDESVRGFALLPVFVESGAELMRHFDLDALRLAEIINEGADVSRKVDTGDIQLIAMSATQAPYAKLRFAAIGRGHAIDRAPLMHVNGNGAEELNGHRGSNGIQDSNGHAGSHAGNGNHGGHGDYADVGAAAESAGQSLRQYIYDKYLIAQSAELTSGGSNGT